MDTPQESCVSVEVKCTSSVAACVVILKEIYERIKELNKRKIKVETKIRISFETPSLKDVPVEESFLKNKQTRNQFVDELKRSKLELVPINKSSDTSFTFIV